MNVYLQELQFLLMSSGSDHLRYLSFDIITPHLFVVQSMSAMMFSVSDIVALRGCEQHIDVSSDEDVAGAPTLIYISLPICLIEPSTLPCWNIRCGPLSHRKRDRIVSLNVLKPQSARLRYVRQRDVDISKIE